MAKKSQMEEFVVRLAVPEGVTIREMQAYVQAAVKSWRGGLCPDDDPLFDLDSDKVKVTRPHRKKSYLSTFTGHVFAGHALIRAVSPQKAAKLLDAELRRIGLRQKVDAEDMEQVDNTAQVVIISNGDA